MPPPEEEWPAHSRAARAARQLAPICGDALRELRDNWRAQALALVGLAWGGASVVLLLAFGAGFSSFLDLGFGKIGDRYSTVVGEYTTRESGGAQPGRQIVLDRDDVQRVRAAAPSAVQVAGGVSDAFAVVRSPRRTRSTVVKAASPDVATIWAHRLASGRFFDATDEAARRPVPVLGAQLARVFFADDDPIGRSLEIEGHPFAVIGVLARKGFQILVFGALDDDTIFVPLRAGQAALGRGDAIDALYANPERAADTEALQREIAAALALHHHIAPGDEGALHVESVAAFAEPARKVGLTLQILLGFVGATTLALAGVGLANLMRVIVKQRAVEFGARRACGARRRDILYQVMVEALVTVFAGGLCGVALSTALCAAIARLPLPPELPLPRISAGLLAGAFAFLATTGFAAALGPARQACRVDPGVALRAL